MKYILALSLLFVANFTIAQSVPQASLVVSTLSELTGYTGSLLQANWNDANRGGKLDLVDAAGLAVDSGIVFPSAKAGKFWKRDITQAANVNIKWFGATGDSSTDAILPLKRAYAAATLLKMNVYFPNGYYKIIYQNLGYVIRLKSYAGLVGDSATIFVSGQTTSNVLNLFATVASVPTSNITIHGMNFVDCGLVSFVWSFNCHVYSNNFIHTPLYFQANTDGTTLGSNSHNTVNNNNFIGVNYKLSPNYHPDSIYRGAGGLQAATGAQSFGLRLSNTSYSANPDTTENPDFGNYDNEIYGNTFKHWSYNAIELAGPNNKRNHIYNNSFDSCYGVCIDVDKGGSFNVVENNYMKNTQPSEVFGRRNYVGPGPTDSVKGYVVLGDIEEQASLYNLPHNNVYKHNRFYNEYGYNMFRSQGSYNTVYEGNEYEVLSPTRGNIILSANTNNAGNRSNLPNMQFRRNIAGRLAIGTTDGAGKYEDVYVQDNDLYGLTTSSTTTKSHLKYFEVTGNKILADTGTLVLSGQARVFIFRGNTVTNRTFSNIYLSTAAIDTTSTGADTIIACKQIITDNYFNSKSEVLVQMNKASTLEFSHNRLDSAFNVTDSSNAVYVFYFSGGKQNIISYNTFSNYTTTRLINYGAGDTMSNIKLYNNIAIGGNNTTVIQSASAKGYMVQAQNTWSADFVAPPAVSISYLTLTNLPGYINLSSKPDGLSDIGKAGFGAYSYTTSATNYPTVSGAGFRVQRNATLSSTSAEGSFDMVCSANTDSAFYVQKYITGAGGTTGWRRIVTVDGTTSFTVGMIPIWNGGAFKAAAITAGSGISVTNSNGAVTIATTTSAAAVEYGGTYSETIAWTAGTAPSGTTNHTWTATQIGKMVTVNIKLQYSVAGATVTAVTMILPSALPAPATPTGYTTNDFIYPGYGGCKTATSGTVSTNQRVGLQVLASSWKVTVITTSQSTTDVQVTFTYWTP